jgi:hypothetical protein
LLNYDRRQYKRSGLPTTNKPTSTTIDLNR